jgi:MoaA/NifB/PqqE/SkfB family radical SAM enzyme
MRKKIYIPAKVFGEKFRDISLAYVAHENRTVPLQGRLKETWDAVAKGAAPVCAASLISLVDLGLLEIAEENPSFSYGISDDRLDRVYAVAPGVQWRCEFVNVVYVIDWHASGKSFLLPGVFGRCWELLDGQRTVREILGRLEGFYGGALQSIEILSFLEEMTTLGFLAGPDAGRRTRTMHDSFTPPWALDQETARAHIRYSPVPWTLVYELTYKCNFTCNTCYAADYMKQNAGSGYSELGTERALRFIGELGRFGLAHITLQGGEPLMRGDWPVLVGEMRRQRMFVKVVTNAGLIDRETAVAMVDAGVRHTDVSLDGLDARTNDDSRCKGAYAKAVRGIRCLLDAGMPRVALAVTLTGRNFQMLEQIPEFARGLGIREVHLMRFVPKGAGKESLDRVLDRERNQRLAELLRQWPAEYPDMFLDTMRWRCDCGKVRCTVDPTGKVRPCTFHGMVCGDITGESIEAVWNGSEALDVLRRPSYYKRICRECADRFTCKATACSARVYESTGELLSNECVRNFATTECPGEFDPRVEYYRERCGREVVG